MVIHKTSFKYGDITPFPLVNHLTCKKQQQKTCHMKYWKFHDFVILFFIFQICILGGRATIKFYQKSKMRFTSELIISPDSWIVLATFKCTHDTLFQKFIRNKHSFQKSFFEMTWKIHESGAFFQLFYTFNYFNVGKWYVNLTIYPSEVIGAIENKFLLKIEFFSWILQYLSNFERIATLI